MIKASLSRHIPRFDGFDGFTIGNGEDRVLLQLPSSGRLSLKVIPPGAGLFAYSCTCVSHNFDSGEGLFTFAFLRPSAIHESSTIGEGMESTGTSGYSWVLPNPSLS